MLDVCLAAGRGSSKPLGLYQAQGYSACKSPRWVAVMGWMGGLSNWSMVEAQAPGLEPGASCLLARWLALRFTSGPAMGSKAPEN